MGSFGYIGLLYGFYKASIRYIDLQKGSCNGNYPPENDRRKVPLFPTLQNPKPESLKRFIEQFNRILKGAPKPQTYPVPGNLIGEEARWLGFVFSRPVLP